MQSKYQNYQKQLNGNYSNQEATVMQTQAVTEENLNQDNRICYKKRLEELNRRVQSIVEKKKQVVSTQN
ncbi:hypothetical protein JS55_08100 (plasmid) [Rickettsia felis str. LSU]|uniref:hypothetical protein n=1 Tax=Rickettsia felis TaxID=42862 RepID=UPI000575980C|nr:hypothetical protein [Rickettsia felis]KHO02201.1 hypothetical protein JS55_08100 [Rickettsia felis str. LSU]KHO02227.1 hypothetical protein JS61_07750 [Rickettsia felis]